ncbi:MAG: YabP/YqfC family sporulation protein [Clostridiales bacterium]|nr:YabP/YqfC family sporulation protein [Clostridiales bacterium]
MLSLAGKDKHSSGSGFRRRLAEMLELPKEVVFNLPVIQALGNEEISVTNYKGLVEYNEQYVRISAGTGIIQLEGVRLILRQVTAEHITVSGRVKKIEFLN